MPVIPAEEITRQMIQSELLLPSWQPFIFTGSSLDHGTPYDQVMDFCDFSCSFPSPEQSSVISSNSCVPTMFPDEFLDLDTFVNEIQTCTPMEGLETISSEEIEDICEWINGNDAQGNSSSLLTNEWSPCVSIESSLNSAVFPLTDMPLVLPGEMEVDGQLSLTHLLRAYGEAMENGEGELAEVIVKSINEKSSPVGNTMERVAYSLFQSQEDQGEYVRMESSKNFLRAFKVLYQCLPNSRFAHFTATTAILESMPDDAENIHVVDYHIGEGIQWPLLIEALCRKQKQVRVTSVKPEEGCTYSCWNFEDTMERLVSHATQYGVKLQIDETSIGDLFNVLASQESRGQGREWLVFNCMVGLPHMGGRRTRRSATEFLKVAKELLQNREGIVVLGDGEAGESLNAWYSSSYSSYFDHLVRHYGALFESLERTFPVYLAEARTAMENLFLSPNMCPTTWFEEWKDMKKGYGLLSELQMEGLKHSQESLAVAKQMVDGGENSYNVQLGTMNQHEMVLRWKEKPQVRVSTWRLKRG